MESFLNMLSSKNKDIIIIFIIIIIIIIVIVWGNSIRHISHNKIDVTNLKTHF